MITNKWIPGCDDYSVAMNIRSAVFGENNTDDFDKYAMHLVVYESDIPVASGRFFLGEDNVFCVSYIGVLEEHRNRGLDDLTAKLLLYKGFQFAEKIYADIPEKYVSFFERYGFVGNGEKYEVHRDNVKYPSKCGKH